MHLGTDDPFHLTYCSNIHPGETWEAVRANLERYLPPLREALAPGRPFGIGLRLSDRAATGLLGEDELDRFRSWLHERDLYVFTMNGFPYGSFHRQVVKDDVYAPDWRTAERVDYTIRLAEILAVLLPEGLDGGISTSPLSYKPWLDAAGRREAFEAASRHLADVAAALDRIRDATGRFIHIDVEPEPDCLIENTAETLDFFETWLLPVGGAQVAARLGVPAGRAEQVLRDHIQVCYDACHFAVEYEPPEEALDRFARAGVGIGKVQLSSALRVPIPGDAAGRADLAARLQPFAESTYLHQVIARHGDGRFGRYADLPAALPHLADTDAAEWRIHYHVPIFVADYEGLHATQDDLAETLAAVRRRRPTRHLEIETYTWDVLPPSLKADLDVSLRREYEWVLRQFEGRTSN